MFLLFVVNLCFLIILHATEAAETQYPIILVPGDGGSQAYCNPKGNGGSFLLWVNLRYFFVPGTLYEYIRIKYDPKTGEVSDSDLCDVTFPGWGDTWSIENLDTSRHSGTVYLEHLINSLRQDPFFVSNKTLRGTPFDFRKAPNENPDFVRDLRVLIEETYSVAGSRPVVLLGHSLGAVYSLAFLNAQSDSWKRKYIKTFLSVSGPYGGSVKAFKIEASGDNFGVIVRSPLSFRQIQRSLPSTAFLIPDPRLWPPSEPIIITPKVNYSAHDYQKFFDDIGFPQGYELFKNTKPSVDGFEGPTGIDDLYCIHGTNVGTTYQMVYPEPSFFHKGFPDEYPTLLTGDGDGTVHLRSLQLCRFWHGAKYITLEGAEHLRIVGDDRLIKLIHEVSGSQRSYH
ncbi:hypothetical protein CRM22_006596 [Opisthorchis felineus]|uniref:AB hydrolase-1 domain-containing protein n=1 Tax=Opisthorchis felineus TaxID=147828 RepID=A0A4S2LKD5_OPIFE|nr:hypothetical protein CRM22_006596 [Opisthorchis felineus]TGZ64010.1 hypothetical protein CRM22_006596 [Opisthorchis felineus]